MTSQLQDRLDMERKAVEEYRKEINRLRSYLAAIAKSVDDYQWDNPTLEPDMARSAALGRCKGLASRALTTKDPIEPI